MAGKYLKSLTTGVVLPYNEPALKSADIRLMEPAECEEYEASMGITQETEEAPVTEAAPEPEPEPVFEEVEVVTSFTPEPEAAPEPDPEMDETDKVMAALEVD